jgi:hypothetical protein
VSLIAAYTGSAGKLPKVVIVAVMRKMITTLNAMVRDDIAWADRLSGRPRAARGREAPVLTRPNRSAISLRQDDSCSFDHLVGAGEQRCS